MKRANRIQTVLADDNVVAIPFQFAAERFSNCLFVVNNHHFHESQCSIG